MVTHPNTLSYNPFVSYLRGWAILSIIIIHLIDWSGIAVAPWFLPIKEFLYFGVMFFVALLGSVVFVAYSNKNLKSSSQKLVWHGLKIIGIYYAYSFIKLLIFNFQTEPLYWQFTSNSTLDFWHILILKSFSAPISILFTLGVFLIISPIFLWIVKKIRNGHWIILSLLAILLVINYGVNLPTNTVTNFLFAKNNITFPLALWLTPYLIGFYTAMVGFQKKTPLLLATFSSLAILSYIPMYLAGNSWHFSGEIMYPLTIYHISAGFAFMFLLLWLFQWLQKINWPIISFKFNLLKILGDATLPIYIGHWIIIDLTYWIFPQNQWVILITVPIFLLIIILIKLARW